MFEPEDIITEFWGNIGIVIGGVDLTYYRDVPTILQNTTYAEPFADRTAVLVFPGITSYETLDDLPFSEDDNVEIWRLNEDDEFVEIIWEGYVSSLGDSLTESDDPLTVECPGCVYQADNFVKPPSFGFSDVDAGEAIAAEFNLRSQNYGLRLGQISSTVWSNTPSRKGGSFNKMLTGWVQELLADATTPSFMSKNESVCAVVVGPNGYWMGGDHGSVISFGDRFPNYGSSTWKNITKIYTAGDKGWYVTDFAMSPDGTKGWWVGAGGNVWPMGGDHIGPAFDVSTYNYGSVDGDEANNPFVCIQSTPSGNGYWLMNAAGSVFTFGDASFHGANPPLSDRTASGNGNTYPDLCIDLVPTPSGNGYWILTWCGRVYEYGDAANLLDTAPFVDRFFTSMERTESGNGLWLMDAYGRVYQYGDAVGIFNPSSSFNVGADYVANWIDLARSETGDGLYCVRNDGYLFDLGDAVNRGNGLFSTNNPSAGGAAIGYTLTKEKGRKPVLRTKNMWTQHWSATVGTPGISQSLNRDKSDAPNVYYGEGTDVTGQKWRNTKYANAFPYSGDYNPPTFPFFTINTVTYNTDAVTGGAVSVWQSAMKNNGWDINVDGVFDMYDSNICKMMQMAAGLTVNGTVDLPTWTTTFLNSPLNLSGPNNEAYIAPLVADTRVEPFLYKANGEILGPNPAFNPRIMRRETYTNYGEKADKQECIMSAFSQMKRFADPGWIGTITLNTDPEEGSRFDIRHGQNILLKGYRGEDLFLHISEVSIDWQNLSVTLTVDSKARDYVTVAALIERQRSIGDPGMKPTRKFSKATLTEDEFVVFDSEASAGYIPAHGTPGGEWNVVRVPAGELGEIVKTEFATYPATLYCIAVFDQPITPKFLNDYTAFFIADDGGGIANEEFWTTFQETLPDKGLMMAWGGQGELVGTYPNTWTDAEEVDFVGISGRFVDNDSWTYWSSKPPWLWVGIWALTSTFIQGRFYGGTNGGFNFSDVDTLANPQKRTLNGIGAVGRDLTFAEELEMIHNWTH